MDSIPLSAMDGEEIEQASQDRKSPGVGTTDIRGLIAHIRDLRRRVALEGLHYSGEDNLVSYAFIQGFEVQMENLIKDIEAERSKSN